MKKCLSAYVTCADLDEAKRLGCGLVEQRLAACVNLISPVHSIYQWQGAVEATDEVVLFAKTIEPHRDRFVQFVRAHHSYEVPCVVFTAIEGGNPDYLAWIERECSAAPSSVMV